MPKIKLVCDNCGKEFFRWPSQIKRKRKHSHSQNVYCSRKCMYESPLYCNLQSIAILNKTEKPILDISKENLAYFAGLFDGDGTITASKRGNRYTFHLSVTSIDRIIVESCLEISGLGHILYDIPPSKIKNSKPYHRWYLANTVELSAFLPLVLPYLRLKKSRAQALLIYCERRIEGLSIDDTDAELVSLIYSQNHHNGAKPLWYIRLF